MAVGGFWTHCGWNSTMEAICEGVPMLAQPCSTDNTVIARYVTHQWGNGIEVGEVFDRAAMAKTIRRLMVTDLGPLGPWERAQLLKMQACLCVAEGGQARLALDDLVRYIVGL
ncbi:hypothetical protein U9M48_012275 [Paspalum notatum var. saurae]|uniref:Uncharacterized protein n=1 Tax=Paspalum notatum var. saurae TaxID=547442 RepID=A0AAQ3SXL3_PASNO